MQLMNFDCVVSTWSGFSNWFGYGNTGQIVKKPNPAVKGSQQTMKLIIATAERLGQTPYSRAKIFEIAATVKALDHTTKNDADKSRKSDTIEDWQNIANTLNNKKGVK